MWAAAGGVKLDSLADDPLLCVVKGTGIALDHLDVYKKAMISKR
jgi:actin-like ATPase involved in cell morphogenesis